MTSILIGLALSIGGIVLILEGHHRGWRTSVMFLCAMVVIVGFIVVLIRTVQSTRARQRSHCALLFASSRTAADSLLVVRANTDIVTCLQQPAEEPPR